MPARVVVVRGYNRGEFFALDDDEVLYLVLEEVEDRKSEVSVRRLAPKEERVAKLEVRAAELRVCNVLPDGGTIAINGDRNLRPGDTVTLGHGDALAVRDAIVRIETDLATAVEEPLPAAVAERVARKSRHKARASTVAAAPAAGAAATEEPALDGRAAQQVAERRAAATKSTVIHKKRQKKRKKKPDTERLPQQQPAPPEVDISITIPGGEAGDEPGAALDADEAVVEAPTATPQASVHSHIVSHRPVAETVNLGKLTEASSARLRRYIQTVQLVGNAALVAQDLKSLMTRTLEIVAAEFKTASGSILWRVPGRDTFRVLARCRHEDGAPHLSRTVLRHVLENGEAVLSLDTDEDDRLRKAESLKGKKMRSVLSVPVIRLGRVVGVVQFDDKGVKKFDDVHLTLVSAVANTIAAGVVALESRSNQLKVQAARGVGQSLREVVMSSALTSDLAHGGIEVSCGFLGEAMSVGVFATVLLRGMGEARTPVLVAAGDLGVQIPKSAIAAFAAQSAIAALAKEEGVPLGRLVEHVERYLAEASLPPLRSAVVAVYDPAEGTLEAMRRGDLSPLMHHDASAGSVHVPGKGGDDPWTPVSMRLETGDTVLIGTDGITRAMGGPDELAESFEFEADEGGVSEVLGGLLEQAADKGEPSVHRSGVILLRRLEEA